jgi:hypothetical protein
MLKNEILDWVTQEFQPISLATPDDTISQIIDNSIRYWNTHSAFPIVKMFPCSQVTIALPLSSDFKSVVKVYPATVPDWVLQNYPLWTLLGITIIDNLTSDLVLLSEAYRNYTYYIGTDFHFHFEKSDNPAVGGKLYLSNLPNPTTAICVVGTKRIINGKVTLPITGNSGTLEYVPIEAGSVILTNGTLTYTENGSGTLVGSLSGYTGTIDYATGAWSVNGWVGTGTQTATYVYYEDIKSEFMLQWLLYYIKALVKMVEGNALRKTMAIDIKNDGQQMYEEGRTEKEMLEKKLSDEGRWLTFARRF